MRIDGASEHGQIGEMGIREGRALVTSNAQTEEHFVSSSEGLAFYANTADTANTLTTTATGGPVLFLKNDHTTKQIAIQKILSSTDTAGTVLTITRNPTLGTIGNNNVHTPPNMNFGKNLTTANIGTFYNWDEVGDGMTGLSGGTILNTFVMSVGINFHPFDGSILLEQGNILMFSAIGAGEFALGVRFYYMDAET